MKLENVFMLLPNRTVGFGSIEIEGDAIAKVDLRPAPSATHQSRLVLPGLVNCHCHAPMTLLRGVGGGLPLQRWLEEAIFPVEAKMTAEDIREAFSELPAPPQPPPPKATSATSPRVPSNNGASFIRRCAHRLFCGPFPPNLGTTLTILRRFFIISSNLSLVCFAFLKMFTILMK